MPLFSKDQKVHLARLARQAYDAWSEREAFEECNPTLSRTKCFEAWRHAETLKVTRHTQSLRECVSERDYLPLVAHFNHLLGNGDKALRTLLRHAEGSRITVYYKLQQALAERGLDEAYAAAICRRQYKTELGDASEKQLWSLFYTVRNRRKLPKGAKPKAAPKPQPARIANDSIGRLSVDRLKREMSLAVEREDYEGAAKYRDAIALAEAPAESVNPF